MKLAGKIIHQMDQARGEVLLEIDLLEVDRNNATKIGITPPSSVRLITLDPGLSSKCVPHTSITALLTLLATIFGGPSWRCGQRRRGQSGLRYSRLLALGGGKSTFSADASRSFRRFFARIVSGTERAASTAPRARRKAGHVLRG